MPSGFRVYWTAEASARNSRCLETAAWINLPKKVDVQTSSGHEQISGFSSTSVKTSVQEASAIRDKRIIRARFTINNISPLIRESLENSWSARLVMFSLLINAQDKKTTKASQECSF